MRCFDKLNGYLVTYGMLPAFGVFVGWTLLWIMVARWVFGAPWWIAFYWAWIAEFLGYVVFAIMQRRG